MKARRGKLFILELDARHKISVQEHTSEWQLQENRQVHMLCEDTSLEILAETMDRVICIFQRKDSILSGKSGKDNPDVSKVELKRIYQ